MYLYVYFFFSSLLMTSQQSLEEGSLFGEIFGISNKDTPLDETFMDEISKILDIQENSYNIYQFLQQPQQTKSKQLYFDDFNYIDNGYGKFPRHVLVSSSKNYTIQNTARLLYVLNYLSSKETTKVNLKHEVNKMYKLLSVKHYKDIYNIKQTCRYWNWFKNTSYIVIFIDIVNKCLENRCIEFMDALKDEIKRNNGYKNNEEEILANEIIKNTNLERLVSVYY